MERPKSAKHNADRTKKSAYVSHKRMNTRGGGGGLLDKNGNVENNTHINVNSPLSYNSEQLHHSNYHHLNQMQHINAQSHGYILQNGNHTSNNNNSNNNNNNGNISEYDLISVTTPNNNINGLTQQQAFVEIADSIVIRQRKEQRFQTSKSAVCLVLFEFGFFF
jgi:cytochrome c biogenesis protein ResB